MHHLAESYFTSIFHDPGSSFPILPAYLPTLLSSDDNFFLNSMPDENEVCYAGFAIGSSKALGPDGFSSKFFQEFWDLIKMDVEFDFRFFYW